MPDAVPNPYDVLVLQGGGALGAYQAGVYQGLSEAGVQPEWVAGISIGAINSAIIAGNPPETRLERLQAFWEEVSSTLLLSPPALGDDGHSLMGAFSAAWTLALGAPGFFRPRFPSPMIQPAGSPEALSIYDTAPLRQTLERLVDFDRINARETRLSVGAVNVRTGNFVYFDNRQCKIGPEHIMASGALPPGLPPVEIDGEAYWDGGLVSNTPLQYVLDEEAPQDLVIYQVDLFSARGPMPRNLLEAAEREKDIRFSSRTRLNTDANLRIHRMKAALRSLIGTIPENLSDDPRVKLLNDLARENSVSVVQLIYRRKAYESHFKDYEFSRAAMQEHWASGLADAQRSMRHRETYAHAPKAGGTAVFDPGRDTSDEATANPRSVS